MAVAYMKLGLPNTNEEKAFVLPRFWYILISSVGSQKQRLDAGVPCYSTELQQRTIFNIHNVFAKTFSFLPYRIAKDNDFVYFEQVPDQLSLEMPENVCVMKVVPFIPPEPIHISIKIQERCFIQ